MNQTKFGFGQLFAKTPQWVKDGLFTYLKVAAILIAILQFFPQIPKSVADPATMYIGELSGFITWLAAMCGVKLDQESK